MAANLPCVTVYEVLDSKYVADFVADSYGAAGGYKFRHYLFLTGTFCTDVITTVAPNIERVNAGIEYWELATLVERNSRSPRSPE